MNTDNRCISASHRSTYTARLNVRCPAVNQKQRNSAFGSVAGAALLKIVATLLTVTLMMRMSGLERAF
jgi:hypothetical protein